MRDVIDQVNPVGENQVETVERALWAVHGGRAGRRTEQTLGNDQGQAEE